MRHHRDHRREQPEMPTTPPRVAAPRPYKVGVSAQHSRRRREDWLSEIRRNNRQYGFSKRRRDAAPDDAWPPWRHPQPPPPEFEPKREDFLKAFQNVWSDNPSERLDATIWIRKLISTGQSSNIEKVIGNGILPRIVEFLSRHQPPELQVEAAWILTNITAGTSEHTQQVVNDGAVPKLIELLGSPSNAVREQVIWALGNIVADSPTCSQNAVNCGLLEPLLSIFTVRAKISTLRIAIWTLSSLCCQKQLDESQVKQILEILGLLVHSIDEKIVGDTCWAIFYLCDSRNEALQGVIEAGLCAQLVKLLMSPSPKVVFPVILAIARISCGTDDQVKVLLEGGVLQPLVWILTQNYDKSIKRYACLTISNVTAGNRTQIQAVIDAKVVSSLLQLSQLEEVEIKKEAAWAILNIASEGSEEQVRYLVNHGCVVAICDVLAYGDAELIYMSLQCLQRILKLGEVDLDKDTHKPTPEEERLLVRATSNPCVSLVEQCGGLHKLERLQGSNNEMIYWKAIEILERYWEEEKQDEPHVVQAESSVHVNYHGSNAPESNLNEGKNNDAFAMPPGAADPAEPSNPVDASGSSSIRRHENGEKGTSNTQAVLCAGDSSEHSSPETDAS